MEKNSSITWRNYNGPDKIKGLINVALGEEKADLVITNGDVLNVYTGELLKNWSVVIKGDRIAYLGSEADHTIGPETEVIDGERRVLIPGLIDGHTHLCWFFSIDEFLKHAMAGGTTTIITETMEVFPIMGHEGILEMLESIKDQPIKMFATAPSMVSISQMTQAAGPEREMLRKLLLRDDILGLGETYWQALIQETDRVVPLFYETLCSGKAIEGHSAGAKGNKLAAYIASGVSSCHESISEEDALDRLRLGIYVMVREGSVRRDLETILKIKDEGIDLRRMILVSDGMVPNDLLAKGYMEYIVQKAINLGFDPVTAIQMTTLNVAEHFSLDNIIGGIAPGRYADILIIPELSKIEAELVISNGKVIARNGELLVSPRKHAFSEASLNTVRLPRKLSAADFSIPVGKAVSRTRVRVIDQVTDLVTRESQVELVVSGGQIRSDVSRDILKVAAIERANNQGKIFVGLVRGFGMKSGAFASTGAWDSSDIVVVGVSGEDMAEAVNRIVELQGGVVVYAGGKVQAELPLEVWGLVSIRPVGFVAARLEEIKKRLKELGCSFADPHLTLTTLTCAAIPHFRICEEGLVSIREGKREDLIVM